jgi:hypothetical protein
MDLEIDAGHPHGTGRRCSKFIYSVDIYGFSRQQQRHFPRSFLKSFAEGSTKTEILQACFVNH